MSTLSGHTDEQVAALLRSYAAMGQCPASRCCTYPGCRIEGCKAQPLPAAQPANKETQQ